MERQNTPDQPLATRVTDALPKVVDSPGITQEPASFPYSFLRPPEENDEIGRLGNYRVLRLLGYGGMGLVFYAEDVGLHRPVALKVVRPNADFPKGLVAERFLREARAMAAIKHDHVITVYQVGEEDDVIYVAMELLEGETLESWCLRVTNPHPDDVARIGAEIARGLDAIHRRGLVHRDIKPMNLWLESPNGRVKILDFGLARDTQDNKNLTESGILVGTPAYLSPEQARGRQIDARGDLFSLGCVLYRLCTGHIPFPAENTLDQLAALAADDPTPIHNVNPAIPERLANLIMELLAKKPEARPPSAEVVAERLERLLRKLPDCAPPVAADKTERIPVLAGDSPARPSFLRHWRMFVLAPALLIVAGFAALGVRSLFDRPDPGVSRTYLSEMKKFKAVNWPFHKNKEGKGMPKELLGPVVVHGQLAPNGIFMHPAPPFDNPSSLTFQLNKQFRVFSTQVSLNDSSPHAPSPMTFSVYGDGKLLWRSQEVLHQDQTQQCEVPIAGVDLLKLEVTAADDVRKAHAVWIDPYVAK